MNTGLRVDTVTVVSACRRSSVASKKAISSPSCIEATGARRPALDGSVYGNVGAEYPWTSRTTGAEDFADREDVDGVRGEDRVADGTAVTVGGAEVATGATGTVLGSVVDRDGVTRAAPKGMPMASTAAAVDSPVAIRRLR